MYDWELRQYLEVRGYKLSTNEYLHVCYTCPQINHVKYDAFSDDFEVWTDDRNYFRFKVYHKE
jgi:hypothetical protein